MICQVKTIKTARAKNASIAKPFAQAERSTKVDDLIWSPLTSGPYLVPVTRWVE